MPEPRRRFLQGLSAMPLLGSQIEAAPAPRDWFAELGVRSFINAAGTYTRLTSCKMPPEVMEAMNTASQRFVNLDELQTAVGTRIASMLQCEAAMVTSGAAGAITVGAAACLAGKNPERIALLPHATGFPHQVVLQRTHHTNYEHSLLTAGARLIEVETEDDIERAAPQAAMMFFLNDATPRSTISHERWVAISKRLKIPTMIDAAADVPPVENLFRFTAMGFDLVAISGGKGIRGPQSSGLLLGRRDLIEAARLNTSPNSATVARGMKVNKEEIVGLLAALELYLARDHQADWKEWSRRAELIRDSAARVAGVTAEVYVPPVANRVPHVRISWDRSHLSLAPEEAMARLRSGSPSIEACPESDDKYLILNTWMLEPGETEIVAERVQAVLAR